MPWYVQTHEEDVPFCNSLAKKGHHLICTKVLYELGGTKHTNYVFTRGPSLEKAMAPHSSTLAWRIPGTGEPSGLQSMGSQRVGHD